MKKIVIATIATLALSSTMFAAVNAAACKSCHGQNWEKKALGKAAVVKDMTKADIAKSLIAYKTTTVGAEMIMKSQVARYSDADLKALAEQIGK